MFPITLAGMEVHFLFIHDYFGKTKGKVVTGHTDDYLFVLDSVRNTDFIFIWRDTEIQHDMAIK